MIVLPCALLFALSGTRQDQVAELVAESRFVDALADVAREKDPLLRAQNELWVRHHAGDLHGALSAGLAELQAHPKDPFLLEQSAFIAITLRKTALAMELVRRLTHLTAGGSLAPEESARLTASARALDQEVRAQLAAAKARSESLRLARYVVLGTLTGAGLLMAGLAWSTARARA